MPMSPQDAERPKVSSTTTTTVTVLDEKDRAYKLERKGDGVLITPPVSFRTSPIPIARLRQALNELDG